MTHTGSIKKQIEQLTERIKLIKNYSYSNKELKPLKKQLKQLKELKMTMPSEHQTTDSLKNKITELAKEVFATTPETDRMSKFYVFCCQQALQQIQFAIENKKYSVEYKLTLINEWSVNLVNYSMALNQNNDSIKNQLSSINKNNVKDIEKDLVNQYSGETKSLAELAIKNHNNRISQNTPYTIIDSLSLLYKELNELTDLSTMSDYSKNIIKDYFKLQYLLDFNLNWHYHFDYVTSHNTQGLNNTPDPK